MRFFRHSRTWPTIQTVPRIATIFRLVQQQTAVLTCQAVRRQYIEELLNGLLASEGQRGQFVDKQDEREWGGFLLPSHHKFERVGLHQERAIYLAFLLMLTSL